MIELGERKPVNLDTNLPYFNTIDSCNPLSIRLVKKITKFEILDGGEVFCPKLDLENKQKKNEKRADWLLTKNAIYYSRPEAEFMKDFLFFDWEVNTHLDTKVKKIKNFHCLRIFGINDFKSYNPHLFRRTFSKSSSSVDFYDFYVETGKELNIATIHSLFKDNKGYQDEL